MYPLHSAQLRLAVLRLAANRAIDRAMRRLHDGDDIESATFGRLTTHRFHERMKVTETNCRWCGLAADEARAELESEDD